MKNKARLEKLEASLTTPEDDKITVVLDLGDTLIINGAEVRRLDYEREHAGDPPHKTIIVSGGKNE